MQFPCSTCVPYICEVPQLLHRPPHRHSVGVLPELFIGSVFSGKSAIIHKRIGEKVDVINYKSLAFGNVKGREHGGGPLRACSLSGRDLFLMSGTQNKVEEQNRNSRSAGRGGVGGVGAPEQSGRHEVTDVLEIHPRNVIYNFTAIRGTAGPRNSISGPAAVAGHAGQGMRLSELATTAKRLPSTCSALRYTKP